MARTPIDEAEGLRRTPPTPPKMTKDQWLRRDKSSVTLSRSELEHVAQLLAAGRLPL